MFIGNISGIGTGCPKKTHHKVLCSSCLISPATISQESWEIYQIKGDIHRNILSTSSFLRDIGELRYRQNNIGYQIIKIVRFRLIPYSLNLIPFVVLPVSWHPNIAQKTACTQIKDNIHRYMLSTSSPLCDIGKPRSSQNSMGYHISR